MSVRNLELTKTDVIPQLEGALFADAPDKRFAIGLLAIKDVALDGRENAYRSYFDLRRNVYVDETGQLSPEDIQEDGTDRDEDDSRSAAFGAFENMGDGRIRTVGALRLIVKGENEDPDAPKPLPVEEFCPDIFAGNPAPVAATEVSRLIARHEKSPLQDFLKWQMYSAGLAYVANHDLGPTYAVVEPIFEKHLKQTLPMRRIGEPRYIEHYLDYNLPIEVFTGAFIDQIEQKTPGAIEELRKNEGAFSYFGRLAVGVKVLDQATA